MDKQLPNTITKFDVGQMPYRKYIDCVELGNC